MQLRYVYSELGQGLRRNLTMHLAVILTLVVSLTLVGIGLLFQQQATRAAEHFGNQLQITVYLCRLNDSNPVCPNPVTEAQKAEIEAWSTPTRRWRATASSPARWRSRRQGALRRGAVLRRQPRADRRGHAADDLDHARGPGAVRGHQQRGPGPRRRLAGAGPARAGRTDPRDHHQDADVRPGTAALLVLAALLLVANTIRLAAFARRKEIGIMRLVGASTLYIALPFLLEALVTATDQRGARHRGAGGVPGASRSATSSRT